MIVTFPTRPGMDRRHIEGQPMRAAPCCCDPRGWVECEGETCLRCGHFPAAVIDETWRRRVRSILRGLYEVEAQPEEEALAA